MILLKEHEGLNDVLIHIKKQVIDSLKFAREFCPDFSTPEQLFYWLKDRTQYIDDPATIELIMTMGTMMKGTRTGVPGGGDCDDMTITALACLITQGWEENQVVLAGRKKHTPAHIYVRTFDFDDREWKVFDLTEDSYNSERYYPYKQYLTFTI